MVDQGPDAMFGEKVAKVNFPGGAGCDNMSKFASIYFFGGRGGCGGEQAYQAVGR